MSTTHPGRFRCPAPALGLPNAIVVAVFLAALSRLVAKRLERHMPGPLASLLTLLLAAIVIGGIGYFVVLRAIDQMPPAHRQHPQRGDRHRSVCPRAEAHLMQPLIVGRYVRPHPLAIGLVLAAGSLVAGIAGAIIAAPVAAVIHRATPALFGLDGEPEPDQEDDRDDGSATPPSSQK